MNIPSDQAFGVGQEGGGERPILRPVALWDLRKDRVPTGRNPLRVDTVDRRCSRVHINVMGGIAYLYWSAGGGHSELPDHILTEGLHVFEFAPRPVQLSIYNTNAASGADDLFVSVLLTNPHGEPEPIKGGCSCQEKHV